MAIKTTVVSSVLHVLWGCWEEHTGLVLSQSCNEETQNSSLEQCDEGSVGYDPEYQEADVLRAAGCSAFSKSTQLSPNLLRSLSGSALYVVSIKIQHIKKNLEGCSDCRASQALCQQYWCNFSPSPFTFTVGKMHSQAWTRSDEHSYLRCNFTSECGWVEANNYCTVIFTTACKKAETKDLKTPTKKQATACAS